MITRMLAVLLATVLGSLAPPLAMGADDAEVRRELEQQYQKLVEAYDRQDRKAIARLLTADFHAILPDGRILDVRATEDLFEEGKEKNQLQFQARYTIRELAVSENRLIAVVEVLREMSWTRKLAGPIHSASQMMRQTWSRTRKGWKVKLVDHIRDQRRFVDGKRVDPTKPFDPDAPPYEPPADGKD